MHCALCTLLVPVYNIYIFHLRTDKYRFLKSNIRNIQLYYFN